MNDLISRQAAITAIQKAYFDSEGGENRCAVWKNVGLTNALHILQDLPSAQTEIVRCKDCRHNYNCDIQYHAQAGDLFYCAYAERREL